MIKWYTAENAEASAVLKQHAFIAKTRKRKYTGEKYEGNVSLCGKIMISDDGEVSCNLNDIEGEQFNENEACKLCAKEALKCDKLTRTI